MTWWSPLSERGQELEERIVSLESAGILAGWSYL
jgi:hypothetical protein